MKKRILMMGLAATMLLFASCTDDDMQLLKAPYRVQGEIAPNFRLPVISRGELNLNQLLQTFDGTFSGNLDVNDTTIVFIYQDEFKDSIEVNTTNKHYRGAKSGRLHAPKSGNELISLDTVISYSVPIDLFDRTDMQSLAQADITIESLLLDLKATIRGTCPPNAEQAVHDYVTARFDQLAIDYEGHDGVIYHYDEMPPVSMVVTDIIEGGSLNLTEENRLNLASIINRLPRRIDLSFHLHVSVDDGFADENTQDLEHIQHFQELLDSLGMTTLYYDADIDVRVPFEVHIGNLNYSYNLALTGTGSSENSASIMDQLDSTLNSLLGEGAVSIDSSTVTAYLVLQNGIPLNFSLSGVLVDENGNELSTLLTNQSVPSAKTIPTQTPGVSMADTNNPGIATIEMPLTVAQLEAFTQASDLRLDLGMSTDGTDHKRVGPYDYLRMSLQIKLSPDIVIDMQLFRGFGDLLGGLPVVGRYFN